SLKPGAALAGTPEISASNPPQSLKQTPTFSTRSRFLFVSELTRKPSSFHITNWTNDLSAIVQSIFYFSSLHL
ncbi:MAG: hypothetical protein LKJ89_06245, partial [Sphaerochaeta sp.]|nr:hypothetical protein [Sphaerochaeta sp.]MCI2104570.1 hypothetical protein [Sphaerochaeta sp.]